MMTAAHIYMSLRRTMSSGNSKSPINRVRCYLNKIQTQAQLNTLFSESRTFGKFTKKQQRRIKV